MKFGGLAASATGKGKKGAATTRRGRRKADVVAASSQTLSLIKKLTVQQALRKGVLFVADPKRVNPAVALALKRQRQRLLSLEKQVAALRTDRLRRTAAELRAVNAGQGPGSLQRLQADLELMRERGITGETGEVTDSQTEEDVV